MSRLRLLFECVAEAVCRKGLKALAGLVPFGIGDAVYEISIETWDLFQQRCLEQMVAGVVRQETVAMTLRASLETAAQTATAEVLRVADDVVRQVAVGQPPAIQQALRTYLTQMPGTIRRSLRRPADPAGTTIPPGMPLSKPEHLLPFLPTRLPRFTPGVRTVGNWQLVELLGTGGFGEVWKAEHPQLQDLPPVALKFCLDPTAVQFLRHEANLLARVMQQRGQPGIVTLRQAYLDADPVCLEYEYVNGGDLSGLVNQMKGLPAAKRGQFANQTIRKLAKIVGQAHRLGPPIVHRDLKPANILVRRNPDGKIDVLVADFGIGGMVAQRAIASAQRGSSSRGDLLASALRGSHTPLYASPQQIHGEPPDPRDDVHALGVIWYQLLTADLSAGAPTGIDWVDELKKAGLDDGLIRLMGSCVSQKAEKRPANAIELAERLSQLLDSASLEVLPVDDVPTVPTSAPTTRPGKAGRTVTPIEPILEVLPVDPEPPTKRPAVRETVRRESALPTVTPVRPATVRPSDPIPVVEAAPATPSANAHVVRPFSAQGLDVAALIRNLMGWFTGEGFATQQLRTEDGAVLLQIEKQGGWRKFTGMSTALNVVLRLQGDQLLVEIGAGRWIDKAAVGTVSLFILWPLAVTAAIGAWEQLNMPQRVFQRIEQLIADQSRPATPTAAPTPSGRTEVFAQLERLADLKQRGIITEEEFQKEKGKLLG